MKQTYDYHTTKKYLEEKKELLYNKLSSMHLSKKEREQLKLEIDNYEYIINVVEMNHYERGFPH